MAEGEGVIHMDHEMLSNSPDPTGVNFQKEGARDQYISPLFFSFLLIHLLLLLLIITSWADGLWALL